MIKGDIKFNDDYYIIFKYLHEDKIPPLLNIYNGINYLNIEHDINIYLKIIEHRANIFKTWLREGKMECYHLPAFTNIELFIHCLKMNFSKKYYGENDYSKVTPNMIILKFIPTKYKTFEELSSKEKEFEHYNDLYKNGIIWVDGLILNNSYLSQNNKDIIYNNTEKYKKCRMNVVGITYTVEKYENINDDNESNSGEENEGEENENESQMDDLKENKNGEEEKNLNKIDDENKVKVYIYSNKDPCVYNKYYIQESIGYIEFGFEGKNNQNFIFEHDIKITIEDLEEIKEMQVNDNDETIYNSKNEK